MPTTGERTKRNVPPPLQKLLAVDKAVTKTFCDIMDKFLPYTKCRKHYKFLEYTCHALPWFFLSIAALWLMWSEDLFQTQVNLLFGLILDCFIIAVTKALVRRRRPAANTNDMFLGTSLSPDVYSFPSGHVSRAFMIAYLTAYVIHSNGLLVFVTFVWAVAVSFSRILLKRHHILDVVAGVVFGWAEGWILSWLWLSRSTSLWIVRYLSYEAVNLEGLQDGLESELVD